MIAVSYTLISEQVLSAPASSITFSSIPQTYTDLVLECTVGQTPATTPNAGYMTFNSDTGTNYSRTSVNGNGSTAASNRTTSQTNIDPLVTTNTFAAHTIQMLSYSNTNVYKTILVRYSDAPSNAGAQAGLWRSTAAISSLTLTLGASQSFAAGSTFRLYGVR